MLSRRLLLAGSAASGLAALPGQALPRRARAEAVLTDDGFYREPWFLESFLELADDLAAASENKKRLAVMWELRGCPYCRETHLVNFAKPEISSLHPAATSKFFSSTSSARARSTISTAKSCPRKRLRAEVRRARRADLPVLSR